MENLFLKYMGDRMEHFSSRHAKMGPVISISRESGCPGNELAEMLKTKLNHKREKEGLPPVWKWVNKEILMKASEELKISPTEVATFVKERGSGLLEDLVSSFSESYYVRNARIKKVVFDVIRNMTLEGHVIAVGRGSGIIAWDIPESLHLYLEAPLSWKANMVSQHKGISIPEARKYVLARDIQRLKFRNSFRTKFSDEIYYNVRFNCKSFSVEEICQIVMHMAEQRKMI
jgi:cytidylate kinase